jgi:hypothetical protein
MGIPRKTMRDIRTLSGKVDRIANPYMAYMQITCLEMEKARKGREKASAVQRVETLDGRLRDIEAEKASLLRALAERGVASGELRSSGGSNPASPRSTRGFKLRY